MHRSLLSRLPAVVVLAGALAAAGCGLLPASKDETLNWSAQRLYTEAHDAVAAKDWDKGIKYFEKLEARYPYGRYAEQALLETAYAQWKNDDRGAALVTVDRFIKLYPNHPEVAYALYLKGLINYNDNSGLLSYLSGSDISERDSRDSREAFAAFKELVTRFPDSRYADDARARMRYLVNALALHEVHVADYYMRRGAYVAAANRAQYAIDHYPQAPAVEQAMALLVAAYNALGMPELRDSAARVLRTNFPNSRYLKGGVAEIGSGKEVPWWQIWNPNW